MRAPLTLLLALSFLVSSLPLHAFAEDAPIEPIVEVPPVTEPVVVDPEPVLEIEIVVEPTPPTPDPVPVEEPVLVVVPVIQEPVLQVEGEEYDSFTLEDTDFDIAGSIALPNGCEIMDASGANHVFPTATTTEYLAVCALVEAVDDGLISEVTVTDSDYGLYVTSIDGVAAGASEYWSVWINGGYGNCGVGCQALAAGDEIAFIRTLSEPDAENPGNYIESQFDQLTLTVDSLEDAYDNVLVPDTCSATDSDGVVHTFPIGDDLLGICALAAAVEETYVSGYELKNESFGLYLTSVDGTPAGAEEYWALWLNDGYTDCGITCLPIATGDKLSLVRTTFSDEQLERIDLRIIGSTHVETEPEEDETGTGGTGGGENETESFDVPAAFSYLVSLQDEDGSIENDLVTDWSAVAFSVSGAPSNAKTLLKNYLKSEEVDVDTASDYIRHAMAMLALNLNPYTAGPEDYITPIVESFDGTQVGEDAYINDDIFALFPLTHAGYDEDDALIQNIVAFVVAEQASDGSWEGVDMTAAAIQALTPLSSLPGVTNAVDRAETYLRQSQESDGGFGNVFATTWAIQAIEALGEAPSAWDKSGNTPLTYLRAKQNEDGSVTTSSGTDSDKAWATAYAIAAAKGATWHELLDDVRKPAVSEEDDDTSGSTTGTKDTEGEVLGVADEVVSEPLTPAFTYEVAEEPAVTTKPAQHVARAATTEEPEMGEIVTETPESETLTASAEAAEGSSWLMRTLNSLWRGFIGFLAGLFS